MEYILITATTLLFTLQTLCYKQFNSKFMKNFGNYFLFNTIYFSLAFLIFFIIRDNAQRYHFYTVILGVAFGILIIFTNLCYMKAMETGPLSFSALFFSFGLLIPIMFGVFSWGEKISLAQVTGLMLLFISFYLGSKAGKEDGHTINLRWILLCIGSFLGNGGLMTLSKQHQILLPGQETSGFLMIAFGTAALISAVTFIWCTIVKRQGIRHMMKPYLVLIILGTAGSAVLGNLFTLILATMISAVIQFPTVNGGVVVLSALASLLIFREKLSNKGIAGLCTGIAALFLVSMR